LPNQKRSKLTAISGYRGTARVKSKLAGQGPRRSIYDSSETPCFEGNEGRTAMATFKVICGYGALAISPQVDLQRHFNFDGFEEKRRHL